MPDVVRNRPINNDMYGTNKNTRDEINQYLSITSKKHEASMNGHNHFLKQKGTTNRSILKAKMEVRTNSDPHETEYNLLLKHNQNNMIKAINGSLVFSPTENANPRMFSKPKEKLEISLPLKDKQSKRNNEVFLSQENIDKKFNSRNDPYQNALSDKTVLRTASEKRVTNTSKYLNPRVMIKDYWIYYKSSSHSWYFILF